MIFDPSLIDGPIAIEGDSGFHLNVAPQVLTEALEAFAVSPGTPERVFADAETVFLRFENEAAARVALANHVIGVS